jgi:hypothetical protein
MKGIVMKWAPLTVIALILAFSDASGMKQIVAAIICIVAFFYALQFDNQVIHFFSYYIASIKAVAKAIARSTDA